MPRAERSTLLLLIGVLACGHEDSPPRAAPIGRPKQEDTRLLETSASTLQSFEPVRAVDTYLDDFHTLKGDPAHAEEAHAFCRARNEEFTQCVLFDANTFNANLIGVEYIISERLYAGLPAEEKALWHPHNYAIASGQMVAPGLPEVAEHAYMEKKKNSYGKTWHTWDTTAPAQKTLPLGQAQLGWSFNADGELQQALLDERDRRMNIDTKQKREKRKDLVDKPVAAR